VSQEFARELCEISLDTGRQVGALVDRNGRVEYVTVGDALRIELPDFKRVRAGAGRFRGLRCIHTHLNGEPLTRDDLTDLSLLRLDAMVVVHGDERGLPRMAEYASLRPPSPGGDAADGHASNGTNVEIHPAKPPHQLDFDFIEWIGALEDAFAAGQRGVTVRGNDRAVLVGVELGLDPDADERLAEMRELARTAGIEIVDTIVQRRPQPDPKYLLGKGKIQDLVVRAWQRGASLVIFDRDLTPGQVRHITDLVEERIVDRTQLILDIFAQHARTHAGRLQVELAQLRYRLPRLVGRGESMSRLAGGIGGRGPGEAKLEVDRRRVRERIRRLEQGLEQVARRRATQRAQRTREELPVLSIVGYTNAGKSTLLNRLTESDVVAEDKLFATLDPSSRRLRFPRDRSVIVTDTVGFIRDLPPDLIAGFRSTLEEIEQADVLLHVADVSSPAVERHIECVRATLLELGLADKPECLILNKCDAAPADQTARLAARLGGVPVSALTGEGLQAMLEAVEALAFEHGPRVRRGLAPPRHGGDGAQHEGARCEDGAGEAAPASDPHEAAGALAAAGGHRAASFARAARHDDA
jgi:GTP-binding protein HflX